MEKTVEVESLKDHSYDGQKRPAGWKYRMTAKDVHVMSLIGNVRVIEEPEVEPVTSEVKRYNRRDMRAKD